MINTEDVKVGTKIRRLNSDYSDTIKEGDIVTVLGVKDCRFTMSSGDDTPCSVSENWEIVEEPIAPSLLNDINTLLDIKCQFKLAQENLSKLQSRYDKLKHEIIKKL
jgi:hypothetical protein